jgi:Uri superfamily endonuclease
MRGLLQRRMKPEPGTYALILKNRSKAKVQVGRYRQIDLIPGYYIYVGSALGPGGLQARVSRHFRKSKRKHWHIDYLHEFMRPFGIWYSHESRRLEHQWAEVLFNMVGMSPIQGFGCSDCRCYSHLFWTLNAPDFPSFSNIVGGQVESESYPS